MAGKSALRLEEAINDVCPWSGDPIQADSLTRYKGEVVGFCNPGCRDKFEKAAILFDTSIAAKPAKVAKRA
jgi:YHS domain-containing protein